MTWHSLENTAYIISSVFSAVQINKYFFYNSYVFLYVFIRFKHTTFHVKGELLVASRALFITPTVQPQPLPETYVLHQWDQNKVMQWLWNGGVLCSHLNKHTGQSGGLWKPVRLSFWLQEPSYSHQGFVCVCVHVCTNWTVCSLHSYLFYNFSVCLCVFFFLCVKVVLFTRMGNLSCTPNEVVILGA